jgi:hypothetical protein
LFEVEKITKIPFGFIQNAFGPRFAAVVVSFNIEESAVQTAVQTGIAEGAKFLPADEALELDFLTTTVTNFHVRIYIEMAGNNQDKSNQMK